MQGSPKQTRSGGGWTAQQVHACDKRTRFGVFASVTEFACGHKKELEPQLAVHGRAGAIHRAQVAPFVINSHDKALFASVIGHTLKGNCISDFSSSAPTTTTLVQCCVVRCERSCERLRLQTKARVGQRAAFEMPVRHCFKACLQTSVAAAVVYNKDPGHPLCAPLHKHQWVGGSPSRRPPLDEPWAVLPAEPWSWSPSTS